MAGAAGDVRDRVLTVPNALPATRHGASRRLWKACGYTFLFNIVGVMPPHLYFSLLSV